MKEPLFSLLIANYNNGKYIKETIDSVYAQDYTNWEIIIVDDASTDNSKEIYTEYINEPRIKVFYNEVNKGVTYTKWRCIENAQGELCGFLDPDDSIMPSTLSLMAKAHALDEDISIVSSRYYACDENMNILHESGYLRIPKDKSYLTNMKYGPWPFISFKMIKYKQTKGLNINNRIGDDQELCLLLEEVGKWLILDDITYKYRIRNNGLSRMQGIKCMYWNMIMYHEACMRRGLNPEKYALVMLKKVLKNSMEYRIGTYFIAPLRKIKSFIK
jgi:glycosyltransferase involved in cell wall biosynthesis